ncbi:unnamed protein product, partial [Laminaria digitata]
MHQSDSFRFQVGLLNEHWLTETARGTPHSEWPQAAVKWVVADRFRPAVGAVTEVFQEAPSLSVSALGWGSTGDESWKAFVLTGNFGGQTIRRVVLELKEKGPTLQDRNVLYADVCEVLTEETEILVDSVA